MRKQVLSKQLCRFASSLGKAKQFFNPRVVDIGSYEDYRYQHHRIQITKGSFGITFFTSKTSEASNPILEVVCDIAKRYDEVTFLKVDVEQPGASEIVSEYNVSMLPTFYFYKSGLVVGKLMGSFSVETKLEGLVDGFVNHRRLREEIRINRW